jgi:hypothetical protein
MGEKGYNDHRNPTLTLSMREREFQCNADIISNRIMVNCYRRFPIFSGLSIGKIILFFFLDIPSVFLYRLSHKST